MVPFFSIIIPTYNRAKYLKTAICSVLLQSFQDFEILVIDDCSEDNTYELVKSIQDVRVKYFKLNSNQGVSNARNFGALKSIGKYISFLDSDDIFKPNKLSILYQVYEIHKNENPLFIYGGWEWKNFENNKVRIFRKPNISGDIEGLPRWCYNIVPDMVEGQFMKKNLFNKNIKFYELIELLINLYNSKKLYFTSEIISSFRDHDGDRLSSNKVNALEAIEYLLIKYTDIIKSQPIYFARLNLTSAIFKMDLGIKGYLQDIQQAIFVNPFSIRLYFYFIKAICIKLIFCYRQYFPFIFFKADLN